VAKVKRAVARLRHDARDAGLLGEDLEGQENLKAHEFRGMFDFG